MTENINTNKPRKLGRFSKFIIIITILLVILGPLGLVNFLIGLLSPLLYSSIPCIIDAATLFFMLIAIIASFVSWRKYIKNKVCGWLMPFGVIFLFVLIFLKGYPPYVTFLHGFKLRVERLANISEIREWLGNLEDSKLKGEPIVILHPDSSYPNWPEDVNWPTSLKKFNLHLIILDKDENKKPVLFAIYNGWFDQWGFVIGDPNMESFHPWNDRSFILPAEKGLYFWYGDLWRQQD